MSSLYTAIYKLKKRGIQLILMLRTGAEPACTVKVGKEMFLLAFTTVH